MLQEDAQDLRAGFLRPLITLLRSSGVAWCSFIDLVMVVGSSIGFRTSLFSASIYSVLGFEECSADGSMVDQW